MVLHRDTFLGIEATNKNITWEAMEFFKIKDGIITALWGSWPIYDMVNLLTSELNTNARIKKLNRDYAQ